MPSDWVRDSLGNDCPIDMTAVDGYLNSADNFKQYKIGMLFGYIQSLTKQLNHNTSQIAQLSKRIEELEG